MLLLAAIFGGWEIVLMIFVVILFGAKNHFRKGVGEVTRDLDDAAHDAGESLGGVYGKSTAQALTPDNQTAEIYDPAVFHNPRAMKWMWFRAARQPASETRGVERHPIPYLDVAVKEAEPILAAVRQLMKNPPPGIAYDISKMMENDTSPNLVFVRVGAQAL